MRTAHQRALEAVYAFTLPRGASVTNFRTWVDVLHAPRSRPAGMIATR